MVEFINCNISNHNLAEDEVYSLFSSPSAENLVCWYKNLEGYHLLSMPKAHHLWTANKIKTSADIINKHEFDLYKKEHRDLAMLYLNRDKIAHEQHNWYGMEPSFWNHQLVCLLVQKQAVVNNKGQIVGSFGQAMKILDANWLKSLTISLGIFDEFYKNPAKMRFGFNMLNEDNVAVSNREAECLFYTLRGKSAKAIANQLDLSPKTVEFYLEQLKHKFNCINKSQLIEKAISLGYFDRIPESLVFSKNKRNN